MDETDGKRKKKSEFARPVLKRTDLIEIERTLAGVKYDFVPLGQIYQ